MLEAKASIPTATLLLLVPSSLTPAPEPRNTLEPSVAASERSLIAEAPPADDQLSIPEPSVVRACPVEPSATGSV